MARSARGEGLIPTAHAASSTTTTRKLIDTDLASVIATGGQLKLIRTADNTWTSAATTACPDGVTYPNAYAKCFTSANAYTQQCTGSNYCGDNSTWDATTSKCIGNGVGCDCSDAYIYNSATEQCTCIGSTMQSFTKAACAQFATPTSRTGYTTVGTLTDARDNKQYIIRKFIDGHCWMAQNLQFGNCASLTGNDFNASYQGSVQNKVASGYYGICRNAADGGNYDGFLYNWQAAMNNSTANYNGTYNNRTNGTTEATHDICPIGWHVPTKEEFQALADAVQGSSVSHGCTSSDCATSWNWFRTSGANAWNASGKSAISGNAHGSSLYYQGSGAFWWSSSLNSTTGAYNLGLGSSNIYPQNNNAKYYGFSVRCLQDY